MNIVFDIGGTNLRVASVEGGELKEVRKVPTPHDLTEVIALFVQLARELAGEQAIECAAGCIPAQIDTEGKIYDASNRPEWNGRNFEVELSAALGAPVHVANDCGVIGLGEDMYGAGKGSPRMAYVTVSTGVGAALIKDGRIQPIDGFFFGHVQVGGEELEPQVSGTAIRKKFGIEPKDLESIEERNKLADILAEGLVILAQKWQPDTIVLGGSMIVGVNPIPLERTAETLTKLIPHAPIVKMAMLEDKGGLYGGMVLANMKA